MTEGSEGEESVSEDLDADVVEMRGLPQEGEGERKDSDIDVEMRGEQEGEEEGIGKNSLQETVVTPRFHYSRFCRRFSGCTEDLL